MASFTCFDGKDAAPVSMAGGKKGRRRHTDKMRELRKERADPEMARRCADAAGVVQRWIRGSRAPVPPFSGSGRARQPKPIVSQARS
ncbi:hypothetical protein DIPPA_34989 [Diplonema papillatum]|nr:hypothetical protein DIPPA_34989 [Diplonema papillatum]